MQLKNIKKLFTEDRAVSPVIGVILMVAITVILAAVIGTFVLGLGDDLQDTSPTASFNADFDTTEEDAHDVTITHTGGDSISSDADVSINVPGEELDTWDADISAGDSITVDAPEDGGDHNWGGETVSLNWASPDGESSATLGSWTAPGGS